MGVQPEPLAAGQTDRSSQTLLADTMVNNHLLEEWPHTALGILIQNLCLYSEIIACSSNESLCHILSLTQSVLLIF